MNNTNFAKEDKSNHEKGIIVSLSGIDGSGKTTLINNLENYYRSQGGRTLITKQPTVEYRNHPLVRENLSTGQTKVGAEAIALLSAFDRLCHISKLQNDLREHDIVFSDRFLLDGIVSFIARGIDEHWVKLINKFCPKPDLEILVDCPGAVAHERIIKRGGEMTYDEKSIDLLENKRQLFLKYQNKSTIVLDGMEDAEILFEKAVESIDSYLEKKTNDNHFVNLI